MTIAIVVFAYSGSLMATLNIVQLEFNLLIALSEYLGEANVTREYNETKFSFPLENGKKAVVAISVTDKTLCDKCGTEIEFPKYAQTTHMYPQVCVSKSDTLTERINQIESNSEKDEVMITHGAD